MSQRILHRLGVFCLSVSIAAISLSSSSLADEKKAKTKPKPQTPADAWKAAHDYWLVTDLVTFTDQQRRIGASLAPVDDVLRSQLQLPGDEGLVVTKLTPGSAAAKAGIQVDDILLTAGGKTLTKTADVDKAFKDKKKPVEVTLLRAGKKQTVKVQPQPTPIAAEIVYELVVGGENYVGQPRYRIGVRVSRASRTLRAQLQLPAEQGLIITAFVPDKDSPAFKGGLRIHDVLLRAGDKPLKKTQDLRNAVQASKGKAMSFTLLRAGQRKKATVTPKKTSTQGELYRESALSLGEVYRLQAEQLKVEQLKVGSALFVPITETKPNKTKQDIQSQLQQIVSQLAKLQQSVKAVQEAIAKQKPDGGAGEGEKK